MLENRVPQGVAFGVNKDTGMAASLSSLFVFLPLGQSLSWY